MQQTNKIQLVGVIGAGAMGSGIAQVAAAAGHPVVLFDVNSQSIQKGLDAIRKNYIKLVDKGKVTQEVADQIIGRIQTGQSLSDFAKCSFVIEAVIEQLQVKQKLFTELQAIVSAECILATNTSSLSVTSIAGACLHPERVVGVHFFNPAPVMSLVEIIPGLATSESILEKTKMLIISWKKTVVTAKDTPGFIVNRLARSYYGEAIRIHEERWLGIPDGVEGYAYIDEVMRRQGFKMGPFELMDLIGNDINYTVTETVWTQSFFDGRYKPSLTQKRLVEAGRFGRKSGHGYFEYGEGKSIPSVSINTLVGQQIFLRILSMLVNEAIDAFYLNIAGRDDLDSAMVNGVNYPKGLLKWCDEIGANHLLSLLTGFHNEYAEERYRPSVLFKKMAEENKKFYS